MHGMRTGSPVRQGGRPLPDGVPRLLRAVGGFDLAEQGARCRHAGGHRTLRVRRALAGAGRRAPGTHVATGRGALRTSLRQWARRIRRRALTTFGREAAAFRRNEGLTWLVLFGFWLLVLWGVIELAGRAGMY